MPQRIASRAHQNRLPLLTVVLAGFAISSCLLATDSHALARTLDDAPPTLAPALQRLLDAEYLSDRERTALRINHGLALLADAQLPAARAKIALQRGIYDDDALIGASSSAADPLDRADANLSLGEIDEALKFLADDRSMRGVRIRVAALERSGKLDAAREAVKPAAAFLQSREITDANALVEACRALAMVLRFTEVKNASDAEGDFKSLMRLLGKAREIDPFSWQARLLEAELLYDKDNFAQAGEALDEAMKLNPASAQILSLAGQLSVATYDLKQATEIADRLDAIAGIPGETLPEDKDERAKALLNRSAAGACVRARAALRQDDPQLALASIAPVRQRQSKNRELLEVRAAAIAITYDQALLDRVLSEYDALSPNSPMAMLSVGKAFAEARQYDFAAKYLAMARDRAPMWSQPVIELGLLHMQSGQDAPALQALEAAARLDPFNVRVGNSLKLMKELRTYARVESPRFIVRSRPGLDAMLAKEMLPVLEDMADIVTSDRPGGIRHTPDRKTTIDLMPDHAWFAVRIAGLPRIHTIAASTGPVIAMESPRDGSGHTGTYDWQRVLRHEYTHTVGLSRTRNRIPHWFTEAQAVYLELSPREDRTIDLLTHVMMEDELFDLTEINIAFTRPKKPTDRAQAYAQGHWMLEYIIQTYGPEAPLKLMDQYAQGIRETEAFPSVLNVSREKFMTQFKDWAAQQLIAWGMDVPAGTLTLEKLLERERDKRAATENKKPEDIDEVEPTVELVDGWLKDMPTHPDLLELAVKLRLAANKGEPAVEMIDLFNRLAIARPMDPLPHRHLARLALASAGPLTPADAIEHLEYLDVREEKIPTYAAQLATLYAKAGDLDRAWAKAQRATRVGPYVASSRELAAMIAIRRRDFDAAQSHLEFLAVLEPDQPLHKQRLEALDKLRANSAGGN